jgi:gas vesicle protein
MNNRNFWKGTLVGAAVGAVAGLLLAPKSGKETQADLRQAARGVAGDLDRRATEVWSDLTGRIDDLKEAAQDLTGEARQESQELIARAELLKHELRDSASKLAAGSVRVKDEVVSDVRLLVDQGSGLLVELERVAKKLAGSAKNRNNKS